MVYNHVQGFQVCGIVVDKRKLARVGGLATSAMSSFAAILMHEMFKE